MVWFSHMFMAQPVAFDRVAVLTSGVIDIDMSERIYIDTISENICVGPQPLSSMSKWWAPQYVVVLYTGTRLYCNTGLEASISEPVFPLLSIRYSFRYIFGPKYFKMHEVYVFCGEQGWKLERQLLFCFEHDVSALLRMRKIVTTCENSRDFLLGRRGGRHSRRHLSNKTMFLL